MRVMRWAMLWLLWAQARLMGALISTRAAQRRARGFDAKRATTQMTRYVAAILVALAGRCIRETDTSFDPRAWAPDAGRRWTCAEQAPRASIRRVVMGVRLRRALRAAWTSTWRARVCAASPLSRVRALIKVLSAPEAVIAHLAERLYRGMTRWRRWRVAARLIAGSALTIRDVLATPDADALPDTS